MKHTLVRIALVVVEALVALSAIAGGLWLVAGRSGLPLAWLAGTPFSDYTIPGLVLVIVVGGSALLAAATVFIHREWAVLISVLAGLLMAGYELPADPTGRPRRGRLAADRGAGSHCVRHRRWLSARRAVDPAAPPLAVDRRRRAQRAGHPVLRHDVPEPASDPVFPGRAGHQAHGAAVGSVPARAHRDQLAPFASPGGVSWTRDLLAVACSLSAQPGLERGAKNETKSKEAGAPGRRLAGRRTSRCHPRLRVIAHDSKGDFS